ncbi:hypothetical protein FACS1894104_5090 [Actinomycetota bacterium]|nr:hypothetical protein FACS1894104_5090 [Actinomycetota bacterium]
MGTAIATWGHSAAIRIPKHLLQAAGLKNGDHVGLEVNNRGHLEVIPAKTAHRHVRVTNGLTFVELFKDYQGERLNNSDAWHDDSLVGAEKSAWS